MEAEDQTHDSSVDDISKSLQRFGMADYSMFIIMLVMCSCIGVYFGWADHQKSKRNKLKERRNSAVNDYLMGGKDMKVFPVAMSLVATFISGITLLGSSTEVYLYGTQYCYILIAIFTMAIVMYYIIIPVFHDLQITSTYEYLQTRFDKKMRLFGSIMFTIATILWLPIVIYVPALAFNQVTGVNIHVITPIVCIVCIFYTCLGGIKAVVWTDVIQTVIMFGSLFLIVIKGTLNVGGLSVVIQRNYDSGRFEAPIFDLDPTIRHTFWTIVVGGTIFWVNVNGLNQNMVQRYLSLKDVRTARKALILYSLGLLLMISLCFYNGLLIYATYYDCDPLTTKLAKAKDQMLPLLVMDILKDLPGLPGIFIAGVFSAALSSLSTGLNSMAAVVLEDFYKPFAKKPLTEKQTGYLMRGTVLLLGSLSVGLVYVVQHMGSVLQLSMSVSAATFGPLLGIYLMGLLFPQVNNKAALIGAFTGLFTMVYLSLRSQTEIATGVLKIQTKPMSIEGCTYDFVHIIANSTIIPDSVEHNSKSLHHISYLYYTGFGALITCVFAFVCTLILGKRDPRTVDPALLAPFMRKYYVSGSTSSSQIEKEQVCLHPVQNEG